MDWFSSLLKQVCPFCRETIGKPRDVCPKCAVIISKLENFRPIETTIKDLTIISAFEYEDWIQHVILMQKQRQFLPVVRWMSKVLQQKIPARWLQVPILWMPGKPFSKIHLVEHLALELNRSGHPIADRCHLVRRIGFSKPQKALGLAERKSRDMTKVYKVPLMQRIWPQPQPSEVLLLDDILTTGATLLGCKRILETELGLNVLGAVTLAHTPRKSL